MAREHKARARGTNTGPPLPSLFIHAAYGPDPKAASAMKHEDRAQEILDQEAESTLAILYKALFNRGLRITSIDGDIKRALEKERGE